MLLIYATDSGTGKQVDVYHEVKNAGKMTEEHHISIFTKGRLGAPAGRLLAHYVLDGKAARELKEHI
jgi:hypothetical protein